LPVPAGAIDPPAIVSLRDRAACLRLISAAFEAALFSVISTASILGGCDGCSTFGALKHMFPHLLNTR
jgi:hypothetical protein